MSVDTFYAERFTTKFETVATEFGIPFSRLSNLLGMSKNSMYALRKSNNWHPNNNWYVDKIKRLDYIRDMLNEYKQFVIFSTKGKPYKFDTDMFFQWVFSLWWNSEPRSEYLVVSPIPPKPRVDAPAAVGPPRPMTKEELIKERITRSIKEIEQLAKNP